MIASELHLSPQQVRVCVLVAGGETDKGIAAAMGISTRTVQTHMENAAERLKRHMPSLRGSPRKIILRYYRDFAGVAAFQQRRRQEPEQKRAA